MSISAALVIFAIVWFILLFIVLSIRIKTQAETGIIVPGTHASAPSDPQIKKRMIWVTLLTIPISGVIIAIILSGIISVDQLDIYNGIKSN